MVMLLRVSIIKTVLLNAVFKSLIYIQSLLDYVLVYCGLYITKLLLQFAPMLNMYVTLYPV